MIGILAALLLPLHFTAPADTLGADGSGRAVVSRDPVRSYLFYRIDERGTMLAVPGYADSAGTSLLRPHAPGTRETVWLSPGASGGPVTLYVLSLDWQGNYSAPSNACSLGPASPSPPTGLHLAGPAAPGPRTPAVAQARAVTAAPPFLSPRHRRAAEEPSP